ncbi:hypothetical protein BRC64_09655 [Halobacteriales archaeon QH_10_67_22]|nr:MAG: hypothetical protein BRC64_09655 [Halobacteriales archaeon QH_10_67_22]
MGSDTRERPTVSRMVRRVPDDILAVFALTGLTAAATFVPGVRETPIRALFATIFVLLVPGWAFVAALFPRAGPPEGEATPDVTGHGITLFERVALSFGTSIAIVPVVGLVLNFTPFGIRFGSVVVSLVGVVIVLAVVATWRRSAIRPQHRFSVPVSRWVRSGRGTLLETESRGDTALSVLFVLSVVLATGSVGFVVANPKQGAAFTEFYLVTENETGELVAGDYPENFTVGESQQLVAGVSNHEHETTTYTVLVELHRVQVLDNTTEVIERNRLNRFETELDDNETWHNSHSVTPELAGERLRLTYLLYRGTPPDDPTVDSAYQTLRLWVTVKDR